MDLLLDTTADAHRAQIEAYRRMEGLREPRSSSA
jgi:hypothetical protein